MMPPGTSLDDWLSAASLQDESLETLRCGSERARYRQSFIRNQQARYRCKAKECRKDFTVTIKSVMESSLSNSTYGFRRST